MSNHSSDFTEQFGRLSELIKKDSKRLDLGATSKFPFGKIDKTDEGELRFAIAVDQQTKTLILSFGKPVEWMGLKKQDAVELGNLLLKRAEEL